MLIVPTLHKTPLALFNVNSVLLWYIIMHYDALLIIYQT